jgi:hypothetical protein
MPPPFRLLTATIAASAAIAALAAVPSAAVAGTAAVPSGRPGLTHRPITLQDKAEFSGYDAATDAAGTTYIGWIGDSGSGRKVHLCTLPRRATACAGGISVVDSLGDSSAMGLRVLVTGTGHVSLVWFHDTVASEGGPQGSEIAVATASGGGPLSAPHDVATAPSFGSMAAAAIGPRGAIWVVTETSALTKLQVRPGFGAKPVNLTAPYEVGSAQLAFSRGTAVLAIQRAGAITRPVAFASGRGGSWTRFRNLARTWTAAANLGLASTRSGVRLLASVSNANYFPVVSRWTGSGFSRPALTGDRNNCAPSSHDPVSDASGRMADVSMECSDVAVANLTDTTHAALVRFASGGTFAGGIPQIATATSGRAWVAWSIESSTANKLLAAPVLLPGRVVTARAASARNRVTLYGPASCLPPVTIAVKIAGSPARHWRVLHRSVRLGRTLLRSGLNGASLRAGRLYALTGTVTFADGRARRTVTARLRFRTCANP